MTFLEVLIEGNPIESKILDFQKGLKLRLLGEQRRSLLDDFLSREILPGQSLGLDHVRDKVFRLNSSKFFRLQRVVSSLRLINFKNSPAFVNSRNFCKYIS